MLFVHLGKINYVIGGIYRPADHDITFIMKLNENLKFLNEDGKKCWIFGNFNIDYLVNSVQKRNLEFTIFSNGFMNINEEIPTAFPKPLIDYTISNNSLLYCIL